MAMPGSPTQTRIVNGALAELGSTERLTSMDDPTSNSAKRAASLWPEVLRDLLSRHPWNFALRRRALNASSEVPSHGWERKFKLPEDCIRWLPGSLTDDDYRDAEREGDYLLSDAEAPLACRYIAYVEDVTVWPPAFVRAMTLLLGAAMAEGVTQSEGIKDRLAERAEAQIRTAKRIDGLETGRTRRSTIAPIFSSWLQARNRPARGRY
jgi:hypothetical protein